MALKSWGSWTPPIKRGYKIKVFSYLEISIKLVWQSLKHLFKTKYFKMWMVHGQRPLTMQSNISGCPVCSVGFIGNTSPLKPLKTIALPSKICFYELYFILFLFCFVFWFFWFCILFKIHILNIYISFAVFSIALLRRHILWA